MLTNLRLCFRHSIFRSTAISDSRFSAFLVAFGIVVATFLGILSTSSTAYRGIIYFFRSCKRKGVLLAALTLIGATLIPTPLGWRFVLYFVAGSMGVLMFLWGELSSSKTCIPTLSRSYIEDIIIP